VGVEFVLYFLVSHNMGAS